MSLEIREGADYRRLLERLCLDAESESRKGGLQPLWLVTPTASLANHLRWTLACRAGSEGAVAVRVATIGTFLRRLGQGLDCPLGDRRHPLLDLLLLELCRRFPDLELSGRLNEMPSGQRLLFPTFFDLADGGFGPAQEDLLKELAQAPQLKLVEQEVVTLYYAWLRLLQERGVLWMPLQVQRLAGAVEEAPQEQLSKALSARPDQPPQVWLYGFYDFTDVNLQVLCACARKLPLRLYFPVLRRGGEVHPAFEWVQDLLEDLSLRLGEEHLVRRRAADPVAESEEGATGSEEHAGSQKPDTGLDKLNSGSGDSDPRSSLPAGQSALDDALLDESGAPSSPQQYFRATFPQGEVGRQPSCVGFQRASGLRSEALAAALQARRWLDQEPDLNPQDILIAAPSAETYLHHIREAFQAFALPLRALDVESDPTPRVRSLRQLAGLLQEDAPAEPLLAYLRDHPQLLPSHQDLDRKLRQGEIWGGPHWDLLGRGGLDPSQQEQVDRFLELSAYSRMSELNPEQALQLVDALQRHWIEQPRCLDPLRQALRQMQQWNPHLTLPLALIKDLLSEGPSHPVGDRFNRRAVAFTSLMRSRGLTARRLIVMGLSSRHLPRRVDEDPLLSDDSRRRLLHLARDVGYRLPIKSRAGEEQLLLFYLLNTSAEAVHWVVPESDESGRRVAASPWVQRYLSAWNAVRRPPLPRGPREQARHLLQEESSGALLPPRLAGLLGRRGQATSTVSSDQAVPHSAVLDPDRPISVTALEDLARCPFRFYAARMAGWSPLTPLTRERELAPLQRGKLLHEALQAVLRPALAQQLSLAAAARNALRDRARPLRRALESSLEAACRGKASPHPLLKEAALQALAAQLEDYLKQLTGCEGTCPSRLEARLRASFPGLPELQIEGRLDRIDEGEFGAGESVVDYKAGRDPGYKLDDQIGAGFRLQASLYPWLWQQQSAALPGFSYVFLAESPPASRQAREAPSAEDVLTPLGPILKGGRWPALSNEACSRLGLDRLEPCQYCDFASLCRRHDASAPRQLADAFRRQAPQRLDFLLRRFGREEEEA
ncbi:MAG TPA: PD-(D/E)XK nuclease family protein [Acidobacteriota bacterium]|nr:PD-(D/E)XK nuclease family protein [Acidobacteriota bacterium]